jgi:hypothetical protein
MKIQNLQEIKTMNKKKAVLTSKLSYAQQAAQKIQQQLRIEFRQALCKSKVLCRIP